MRNYIEPEVWRNKKEYWLFNDGYGMCNTGWWKKHRNHRFVICSLGGIGCNVDHAFVQARNLKERMISAPYEREK